MFSEASASGAKQKQGQRDWVTGARDMARGIGQMDTAPLDVQNGTTAAGKTTLLRAERTLATGGLVGERGDKLLGIPTSS